MIKVICVSVLALTALAWAQFADDKSNQIRYIGEFQVKEGISLSEAEYVQGSLISAYSGGGFDVWTSKNLFDKMNKEKAKAVVKDCMDTSCITRAYSCRGISGSLGKIGSKYSLILSYVSETGATVSSKTILIPSLDNLRLLKNLMAETFLYFEKGRDFDETRYADATSAPKSVLTNPVSWKATPLPSDNKGIKTALILSGLGTGVASAGCFVTGLILRPSYDKAYADYSNATSDVTAKYKAAQSAALPINVLNTVSLVSAIVGGGLVVAGLVIPEKNKKTSFYIAPNPAYELGIAFAREF